MTARRHTISVLTRRLWRTPQRLKAYPIMLYSLGSPLKDSLKELPKKGYGVFPAQFLLVGACIAARTVGSTRKMNEIHTLAASRVSFTVEER